VIRRELSPAMLGSLLLHGGLAAALLISWNFTRDLKVGAIVPVTLVTNAEATDLRAAEQAPEVQTAQTEAPVPDAPAQSVTPEPAPQPAPKVAATPKPTPAPAPTPAPKPVKPQPAAKVEKGLDLDALAASVSKSAKSSAARGPARTETALQARPALGAGLSAAAMSGLTEELQRRWNPNCDVEGGRDVQVRVVFTLGAGGQVVGQVASQIRTAQNAVSLAAAERAVRAVYAAAPFRTLPREFYGDRIAVNFNAREACS